MIAGGSALASVWNSNQQNEAIEDAQRAQTRGVQQARADTQQAVQQALPLITGVNPAQVGGVPGQNISNLNNQLSTIDARMDEIRNMGSRGLSEIAEFATLNNQRDALAAQLRDANISAIQSTTPTQVGELPASPGSEQGAVPNTGTLGFVPSIGTIGAGGLTALGRLAQSEQEQQDIIGNTFDEAGNLISPLADYAMPFFEEQRALTGMAGEQAQQAALDRAANPLINAQNQAFLRNQAALGGTGLSGNLLSGLAEQTRQQTEGNISQRLAQLQSAGSPALTALQQLSQNVINRGSAQQGVASQSGVNQSNLMGNIAQQIAAAQQQGGTVAGNVVLGQGSTLAQLAQNLGTAQSIGPTFRAQQVNPLVQGLQTGLGTYLGLGGTFPGFGGGGQTVMAPNAFRPIGA
jgi:hypothetical protein